MNVQKTSPDDVDSTSDGKKSQASSIVALKLAMSTLSGHADAAFLGQIHQIAIDQFGLRLSMEEAADLLVQIPGVRVERGPLIEQWRVFAAEYWKR